jgi:hypothetical protein
MSEERLRVIDALNHAGVDGARDFGRFVSNTEHFAPCALDERAAMPVLLGLLPSLSEPGLVAAVAGHLRRPWARPAAFDVLLVAFRRFGIDHQTGAGWHLADALVNAADATQLDRLLELAKDQRYGKSRQMLVDALWRFRSDSRVEPVLAGLCGDPTIALHAMSAYRRTVGNEAALPLLRELVTHDEPLVRDQAARQVKKADRAGAKRG